MNYEPLYTFAEKHRVPYNELCNALRSALAAPMPEPVAWYLPSPDGNDSIFRDHRTVIACTGNKWEGFQPLYTAPPAAPAPAVCDGGTCGLGGYCANCPRQSAAPARPDEFTCPYCFDQGAAPVVPDIANPITDEQIIEAASNWDCGTRHENEEWAFKRPRELLQFARAVLALSAAPVVREPQDERIAMLEEAAMADPIKLPPLPKLSANKHYYTADQLRARDLEVARCVLEAAAEECESMWGGRSSMSDAIRALEVSHG